MRRAAHHVLYAIETWRRQNRLRVRLDARPPLFHPDFPFILFWSEKAGCTAVVKWFLAQVGELDEALAVDPWVHSFRVRRYSRRGSYMRTLEDALLSGDYTPVKIVRDPLRRAASSFLVLAEQGAVVPQPHWVQQYWEDIRFWLQQNDRDPHAGVSFLEHLTLIDETMHAGRFVDSHILPQYLEGEDEVLREVVPIERFAQWCQDQVARGLVRDIDVAGLGHSGHHHILDDGRTRDLGERPEECQITPGLYSDNRFPNPMAFINERSIPLLTRVYGADMRHYGRHYARAGTRSAADARSSSRTTLRTTPIVARRIAS